MTVVCGGGTSSSRPGFGDFIYMAPAAVGALLNNIPTVWAVPLAAYIGHVEYELVTFCQDDPPPVPTFTAADVAALFNPFILTEFLDARNKLRQLVGAYLWYQVCKCDSVTTPAPPSPPAAPSGMPSINPPAVSPAYPTGQPCASYSATFQCTPPASETPANPPLVPIPAGANSVTLAVQPSRPIASADLTGWQAIVNCFDTPTHFIGNPVFYGESSTGTGGTLTAALPAGTLYTRAIVSVFHVDTPVDIDVQYSLYCGSSSQPSTPLPCPSDPFVIGLLDEILALVTLIQRQAVPFAYVPGTVHAGLTGMGHFDVQGILGVKVQLDSTSSYVGVESADPDVYWDAGWINWSNNDGAHKREFIGASPFVSLPTVAGQYTRVGYTLPVGVSVTITELVREP